MPSRFSELIQIMIERLLSTMRLELRERFSAQVSREPTFLLLLCAICSVMLGGACAETVSDSKQTASPSHVEHEGITRLGAATSRGTQTALESSDDAPVFPGLVSIGRDPQSRLWEYEHLGTRAPESRSAVLRSAAGVLERSASTGVVFVYLPGGMSLQGIGDPSHTDDSYDQVELSPFLCSKFELTRAQLARMQEGASRQVVDGSESMLPAVLPKWEDANRLLLKWGMSLPSDAHWEYACRGGTKTRWFVGDDPSSLGPYANLFYGKRGGGQRELRPTGSLRPNQFGLHDICGNVEEWTDRPNYTRFDAATGELRELGFMIRGGSFATTTLFAASWVDFGTGVRRGERPECGVRPTIRLRYLAVNGVATLHPMESSVLNIEDDAQWKSAIESISNREECPLYEGLRISRQHGLTPLGRNRATGLWEFAHLESRPIVGQTIVSHSDSKLGSGVDSELVLVLLPGGTWSVSSENDGTPFHASGYQVLSPYFISKYEMTQGQWTRLTGWRRNGYLGSPDAAVFPVNVPSWGDGYHYLRKWGMSLPSDAQWGWALTGGCKVPLASALQIENLRGSAHIQFSRDLTTGLPAPIAVGTLRPNSFGLHDMIGNVAEWCLDQRRAQDGGRLESQEDFSTRRLTRGGNCASHVDSAAINYYHAADSARLSGLRLSPTGIRPVRPLD